MKYVILFVFVFFSFKYENAIYAQVPSSQGKEFYFSFMQNGYRTCNGSTYYESLTCIISSDKNCSGRIFNPNTDWSIDFDILADKVTTIVVPKKHCYNTNSEEVENLGMILITTDTVSLCIANEATDSYDVSMVLPFSKLGSKYIIQTYTPSYSGPSVCDHCVRSAFLIIATENNTIIDIIPTCSTAGRNPPGEQFSVTLNKGQTYQVLSKKRGAGGDFSGSLVQVRDTKKIVVFNGNTLTGIPASEINGFDHIFGQAKPTSSWGRKFAIVASESRSGDFCRVTALNDNTALSLNGNPIAIIDQRDTYEFALTDKSSYLETTGPCAVYLYQTTGDYDSSIHGDPSMVRIIPVEQQIKEVTFATCNPNNTISNHYINIVTSTSDINSLTFDNESISSQFKPFFGNPHLSYVSMNISQGTHTIKSEAGFTAYVYGFGNANGYAYSVGSNALDLAGLGCAYLDTASIFSGFEIKVVGDLCRDEKIQLFVPLTDANYYWNTGDTTASIDVWSEGTYTVEGSIEGCTLSRTIDVFCPCELWIPNAFTPNGDNINDSFLPITASILSTFSMYIYDRWGDVIYTTHDHSSWDGGNAASGVYNYVIYYSCMINPDEIQKAQGTITLMR